MIVVYVIFILVLLILLIPIRIKTRYGESERKELKIKNKVQIYILYFFKIKTIELKNKRKIEDKKGEYKANAIYKVINEYINYYKMQEKIVKKEDIKNLIKNIYYEKLNIDFRINLQDPIINAYIITIINVLVNIFIMKNQKKMNLEDVNYTTNISDNIFNLHIDCTIRIRLINIIMTIIKIMFRVIKLNHIKKIKEKDKKREKVLLEN